MIKKAFKNPMTQKRILRFKELKRAHLSLWILAILYMLSLCSEIICNNIPIYVKHNGKSYYPVLKYYTENQFTGSGKNTRPDYKKLNTSDSFKNNTDNFMLFPPFPYGPYESIDPKSIPVSDNISLVFHPVPKMGTINITKEYRILKSDQFKSFVDIKEEKISGLELEKFIKIPDSVKKAIKNRFANKKSPRFISKILRDKNNEKFIISLSSYYPRAGPPKTVRLTFREVEKQGKDEKQKKIRVLFNKNFKVVEDNNRLWNKISPGTQQSLLQLMGRKFTDMADPVRLSLNNRSYIVYFKKEDVSYPFMPCADHPMGIDSAGRDVLARVLYGLRTSLTFGFMLVVCSIFLGIVSGAFQGYYGGIVDITAQRFTEIWSALPFLYVMILMGSVYGRSFSLLLFCYGLFNWIGISYYVRAEFLRLRRKPFVEAAKCMGLPSYKIIFKHILPNAMVPVITFFPFSLVGAIGALAALDYLGFGLPPPTPSWGELLFQAQQYRWAWWLIMYPSLALFIVMLLGVFIGEGIRNAYDPKRYAKIE